MIYFENKVRNICVPQNIVLSLNHQLITNNQKYNDMTTLENIKSELAQNNISFVGAYEKLPSRILDLASNLETFGMSEMENTTLGIIPRSIALKIANIN